MIQHLRHSAPWGLVLCLALPLAGCDAFKDLRSMFHPDEEGAKEVEGLGSAGLRVEVEPGDGLTILVDGNRVASVSPYESETLKAGVHELEVRAMGYHPIKLPVTLQDGEILVVPVSLRPRDEPPGPPPTPTKQKKKGGGQAKAKPRKPPPPPPPPGDVLPEGIQPITLQIVANPKVAVKLDGTTTEKEIVLDRLAGQLTAGTVNMRYRVTGDRRLRFTIPRDNAKWTRDNKELRPGGSFLLATGVTRLKRDDGAGQQTLIMRRR